uniref:Dirigent protein n=1 Tax=Leersia perrieri TaxID=77586 RepID=A0A0D9V8J5_9ORYZ
MTAAGSSKTVSLCLTMILLMQQLGPHFTFAAAASIPSPSDNNNSKNKELHGKMLRFTLYQQETVNKTSYMIVSGVAGVSETTTPFGTVYVFRDELTVRADRSSRVAGVVEGTSVTTGFDGLRSLSLGKITIDHHRGRRGSVSVLGGTHNTMPSDCPVVGGTGDFGYAAGFVRTSPVEYRGPSLTTSDLRKFSLS